MTAEAFGYRWVRSNGQYYCGIHRGSVDDRYAGSGVRFIRAYGGATKNLCVSPEDWTRTIEFRGTREECLKWEATVVNESMLEDANCLNLVLGGGSGCAGFQTQQLCDEHSARMKGSGNSNARLTEEQVVYIKYGLLPQLRGSGRRSMTNPAPTQASIAADYGVSPRTIKAIKLCSIWRHI